MIDLEDTFTFVARLEGIRMLLFLLAERILKNISNGCKKCFYKWIYCGGRIYLANPKVLKIKDFLVEQGFIWFEISSRVWYKRLRKISC